ncbi:hypothetical protein WNZ15_00435 [Roseibium sp. AS2]|uniref:hypothetical protein n=1 Tax=Roseibium sp. AS2 TaxID=3135781 RepID=UPI00317D5D74
MNKLKSGLTGPLFVCAGIGRFGQPFRVKPKSAGDDPSYDPFRLPAWRAEVRGLVDRASGLSAGRQDLLLLSYAAETGPCSSRGLIVQSRQIAASPRMAAL